MNTAEFNHSEAYRIMLKNYPDVLDIKQMCEVFGISVKTGYRMLRENKISCLKIGRTYRIPKTHIVHYLNTGHIK
jgi:excisionase family DNA binding protein